jgi:hypothetical protein
MFDMAETSLLEIRSLISVVGAGLSVMGIIAEWFARLKR